MKALKLLKNIGLVLFLGLTITACSSDDSKEGGPDNGGFFNPKDDWKVTVVDSYDNSTEVYTFSTDEDGISNDSYGDIGYTKLSYKNKQVTMTLKDYEGYTVPSIIFDAPNPAASQFVTVEEYEDTDDNGQIKTFKSKITLERTSKSDNPNPNPNPEPDKTNEDSRLIGTWQNESGTVTWTGTATGLKFLSATPTSSQGGWYYAMQNGYISIGDIYIKDLEKINADKYKCKALWYRRVDGVVKEVGFSADMTIEFSSNGKILYVEGYDSWGGGYTSGQLIKL